MAKPWKQIAIDVLIVMLFAILVVEVLVVRGERDRASDRSARLLRRINAYCNGVHDALADATRLDAAGDHGTAAQIFLRIEEALPYCAAGDHPRDPFDKNAWLALIPVRDIDDPTLGDP